VKNETRQLLIDGLRVTVVRSVCRHMNTIPHHIHNASPQGIYFRAGFMLPKQENTPVRMDRNEGVSVRRDVTHPLFTTEFDRGATCKVSVVHKSRGTETLKTRGPNGDSTRVR